MKNALLKIIVLSTALFVSSGLTAACSAEQGHPFIQSEVTKRDARGRVQVMETRTGKGTCIAEITYDGRPRIYVVVISRTMIRNLGHLLIRDGTEDNLVDEVLMSNFNKAIKEHCLHLIVPGYVQS